MRDPGARVREPLVGRHAGTARPGRRAVWIAAVLLPFAAGAATSAPPRAAASDHHREAYYYYSLAQGERLRRNYLQAARHLRHAVELDSKSAYLHLELARILRTLRQNEDALEEIRRALEVEPDHAESHRLAAEIHVALMDAGTDTQENLRLAIEHYEGALKSQPELGDAGLSLGRLYFYRGDTDRALEVLQRYRAQNPDSAEALFWLAKVHLGREELDAAESNVRQSLRIAPDNYESLLTLSGIQEMREQYEPATGTAERALAVAQDSVEVRYALARLALKRSDFARAAREYQVLLSLLKQRRPWVSEAELADLYLFTARARWFSDEARQALDVVREGKTEFPGDPRFRLLEGELLMATGREGEGEAVLEEVLNARDAAEDVREKVADAYFNQGATRERQGKHAQAEHYLKRAIAIHPKHATALNYLGYMLVETSDRYGESLQYIERAVDLDPENGDYLDSLGWVQYKLNRLEEAEKRLRQALERTQENAVVFDHLGDVVLALGRPEEAAKCWESALERAKGLEHPDKVREKLKEARKRAGSSSRP